LYNYNNS